MIQELGKKYICDVCDASIISHHGKPDRWTTGYFKLESGYQFGEVMICSACYGEHWDRGEKDKYQNVTFRKLYKKFGYDTTIDQKKDALLTEMNDWLYNWGGAILCGGSDDADDQRQKLMERFKKFREGT